MKAGEWIDRLQKKHGWSSDYRVAKELKVAASTLSRYRNKPESTMDDDTAIKVALALQERPEVVLLDQVVERTKSDTARAALQRALKQLGGAVAGAVLAVGLAAPSPAPAETVLTEGLCIMSNRKRRRRNGLPPLDVATPLDLLAAFAATSGPSRFASL